MGSPVSMFSNIIPVFIPGQTGDLFALYYTPIAEERPKKVIRSQLSTTCTIDLLGVDSKHKPGLIDHRIPLAPW